MGCIEIIKRINRPHIGRKINRNMGCIEIIERKQVSVLNDRLIETWDVLK